MATAVVSSEVAPRRWRLPERLPSLSGTALIAYRATWILAAVLALLSATILAYRNEVADQSWAKAFYSTGLITWGRYADGAHFAPFSAEAHRAGVEKGAVLLSVDGKAAPGTDGKLAELMAGPEQSPVRLTLRQPGGAVRDVVLTRSNHYLRDAYAGSGLTWSGRRWAEFVIDTVASLLLQAAAALLFVRRPRDPVAALLSMGMVIGEIKPVLLGGNALVAAAQPVASAGTLLLILGALFFPDGRLAPRWWPVAAIAVLLGQAFGIIAYWNGAVRPIAGPLILASAALTAAAVVSRYRAAAPGISRQQSKFAMLGFVAAVLFLAISQGFDQGVQQATDEGARAWSILGRDVASSFTSIAFASGLLVALLRYRLYDAETAIGRSAAYGILTLGFIALFAGSEKLAELIGERYFEHSVGIAAGAIGAAVAAVCIVPLHNRVHRWAERRFQKPLIRLREGLPECVADLRESAPVGQLVEAAMKRVEAGVRSRCQAVLLLDKGKLAVAGTRGVTAKAVRDWRAGWTPPSGEGALSSNRGDPLFPLRVRLCIESGDAPETIGWLLLGPRPDGSFFGKDEREAIEHVAAPVARAIHIAQLRERRDAEAEERLSGLERLIARLADAMRPGSSGAAPA